MAEANAQTARKTAERAQTFALTERLATRLIGLVFAVAGLAFTSYLAINGHDWVAGIVAGTTIAAVTAGLVLGKSP